MNRKYFLLLFLFSCARDPDLVGTKKTFYEFKCLKRESKTGLHMPLGGGSPVMVTTSSCVFAKCAKVTKTFGKYIKDDKYESEFVEDNLCLK